MPTNSPDYRRKNNGANYKKYQGTKARLSYRSGLVKANRENPRSKVGDGKDIMHVDNNPRNFSKSNLRIGSRTLNRRAGAAKANRRRYGA